MSHETPIERWGPIELAGILEGMLMVDDVLTILGFFLLVLEKFIDSNIPSRLLGVHLAIRSSMIKANHRRPLFM